MHKQIRPISHVVASGAISAAGFWITGSKAFAIANFLTGIFIDLDHFLDYYYNKKKISLNIVEFYNTCIDYKLSTLYIFFHCFEALPILWLIAIAFPTNLIWWGITIGVTQHLIFDTIFNKITLKGYFFIYRLLNKFDMKKLMKDDEP